MADDNVDSLSKKVGGFLGYTCVPIVKVTGFCLSRIYKEVTDGWDAFSKVVSPELEHIKNGSHTVNIDVCLDNELEELSDHEETV